MDTNDSSANKETILALYDEEDQAFMRTISEAKVTGVSRAEEILALAKQAGFMRIGIAYCVAFKEEASVLKGMFADEFDVTCVDCQVFGIEQGEFVEGATGVSCNPVGQAKVLNDAGTQLNVVMGLCLGHDILFAKHSQAPVTTLIVKDRVHDHHPVLALRSA